jgi:hypothetical protein
MESGFDDPKLLAPASRQAIQHIIAKSSVDFHAVHEHFALVECTG